MKYTYKPGFLALSSLFLLASGLGAQTTVQSRVAEATVYSDRALVTRRAELELKAGEQKLVFSGLPSVMDQSSVQVAGKGGFALRDVRVAARQLARDVSRETKALEDERKGYEEKLVLETDRSREAEAERAFLSDMAKRVTGNAGESEVLPLDPASWTKMLDFYRTRLQAVNALVRDTRKASQALQLEIDRVNRAMKALGSGQRLSVVEVELTLDVKQSGKVQIDLSYIVSGPSWRPDYALRAASESSKLSLHYRALVRQNSGEDWTDATIKLSTARPQTGGAMPTLSPWYIDIYRPAPMAGMRAAESAKPSPAPMAKSAAAPSAAEEDMLYDLAPMEYAAASASTGATSVVFVIPGLSNIASDNAERTLTVATLELPASYSYAAVPKLSPFAYFRAEVTNSSDMPFLPGTTHVYVDGGYVADASMGNVPSGGTFKTDLGVDEAIKVERKLKRKFDETTGLTGKTSKTTWEYAILVKNGKRADIAISVYDQLPVSANEQVKVKATEPAYSKDTDILKKTDNEGFVWNLKLAPGKETVLPLSFSVEYPKGSPVTGLE